MFQMFSLVVDAASRCGSAVILVMLNERNQSGIYDAGDGGGGGGLGKGISKL